MHTNRLATAVLLLGGLLMSSAMAADGHKIASQGMGGAPCLSCHGAQGEGNAAAGFPRLAGMNAAYLARQLRAFKDGSRKNPVMAPQAAGLDDAAIQAVARYYAGLPAPATTAPATADKGQLDHGRRLAQYGRWSDDIPACVQCHGPGGRGIAPHFPALAGQHASYISAQLKAWQQDQRQDDPNALMATVAKRLTDADIQAVAAWFASRPATAE